MVVYDLNCAAGHAFEGWFKSPALFEEQAARGLVACPVCDCATVSRRPSAIRMLRSEPTPRHTPDERSSHGLQPKPGRMLEALRRFVDDHCEDVGRRFASEARRMHYGEVEERGIRGVATADQVRELHDEGIEALPLFGTDHEKLN